MLCLAAMVKTGKPAHHTNVGIWTCFVLVLEPFNVRYLPQDKWHDGHKKHAEVFQEVINCEDYDITVMSPNVTCQGHPLFKKSKKPFAALRMSKST